MGPTVGRMPMCAAVLSPAVTAPRPLLSRARPVIPLAAMSSDGRGRGRDRSPGRGRGERLAPAGGRGRGRDAGGGRGRGEGRGRFGQRAPARAPPRRPSGPPAGFFSADAFADAGAPPALVDALAAMGVVKPSHIQAAALKALIGGGGDAAATPRHVVLADHAGSGKTLAYLTPLAASLLDADATLGRTAPGAPRALVLAPTSELCVQVLSVARALARGLASTGHAPFRSVALTGGHPWRTQRDALAEGPDLVIATPGRAAEHARAGGLDLSAATTIVLDEADVLLADSGAFAEQVAPLRAAAPATARFVLVTATLPEPVWAQLEADPAFGGTLGLLPVLGPGLHRPAPGVTQVVVDCSGGDDFTAEGGLARKATALVELLAKSRDTHTVVFCNTVDACRKVENVVRRQLAATHTAHAYHAAVSREARDASLAAFRAPGWVAGGREAVAAAGADDDRLPPSSRHVLIATDRASRGVDTTAASHVVLFDFPRDPSEYVRRAGRVARGGAGGGTVSLLVLGRQVPLAREVVERGAAGLPVHAVPAGGA